MRVKAGPRQPIDESALKNQIQARLVELSVAVTTDQVRSLLVSCAPLLTPDDLGRLTQEVMARVSGMGALQPLLADEEVTDVMVVGGRGVWVDRAGEMQVTALRLTNTEVEHLIEKVVAPLGLRIDRSSPMVDARLPDGSRVNAVVPPLAVDGPCLTIRRFASRAVALSDLAAPPIAEFLAKAVRSRQNIIVSGGTGAGKTTLLNALAGRIDSHERVITVEDVAELQLARRHVVRLEARPSNSEGVGQVTVRDLVRNALRMRPDRIVVGEVRGPEALDMLQAMNTGHEGSMSTCHANSAADSVSRLETMVLTGDVGLPLAAVQRQIAATVDLIVHMRRTDDGQRQVAEVSEVVVGSSPVVTRQLADGERLLCDPRRPRRRVIPEPKPR